MKLSRNELITALAVFVIYSSLVTAFIGIRTPNEQLKMSDYEIGRRIGSIAKTEYLIESKQLKTPVLVDYIRIKAIEDSLELKFKR